MGPGICYDIVLHWDPRSGSVARLGGPRGSQLGSGMAFFGTWVGEPRASQLGWVYLGLSMNSLTGRFMLEKRTFSTENEHFLGNSWDFLENSWISFEFIGHGLDQA